MRKPISVQGERILSTFDINDLLENRSYIKFYAGRAGSSGDYLSSSVMISSTVATGDTSTFEINFDAQFQSPAIVDGDMYVKLCYGLNGPGGSPQRTGVPSVRVLKYDGSSETVILDTLTFPQTYTTTGVCTDWIMKGESAKTHFKIGDKLRLEVIMTVGGSTNATPTLFHSPDTRTTAFYEGTRPTSPDDSALFIMVPFIPNL